MVTLDCKSETQKHLQNDTSEPEESRTQPAKENPIDIAFENPSTNVVFKEEEIEHQYYPGSSTAPYASSHHDSLREGFEPPPVQPPLYQPQDLDMSQWRNSANPITVR